MQNIKLNNNISMPMLGLGVFRVSDHNECVTAVKTALASGYKSIDTAAAYKNEEAVGQGIRESGVSREEIFLTTKLWNDDQRQGCVHEAFEASLKRLGVDYVDLYLIHWPCKGKYNDAWKKMEEIYKSGRAKSIGVSNFHEHHLKDLAETWEIVPAVNQVECHPHLTQKPLIEYCNKLGIVFEAWSPIGAAKNGVMDNPVIKEIAKKHLKSPAQVILRWDIDRSIVTIPKSTNESRIKENIDIFDFHLTLDEIKAIDALNKNERVGSDPDNFTF